MIRPPLFSVTRDTNSCTKDNGMVAMIPTVISKDIPFPIPLSVIFSPSHIANMVPVTNMITEVIIKVGPFPRRNAESGTPRAPKPYKYAGACTTQMAMVNQRVIWLIVLRPLSPSFCNF